MRSLSSPVHHLTNETIMSDLTRLFHPRSVAIIGASPDITRGGGQPVHALLSHGFKGKVFPVNPKYKDIAGARCYPSVADIEEPCDLVVIALSADAAIDAVAAAAKKGIPYAVIYGAGFREAGTEGVEREARLIRTAREGNVRFIGPNCLGLVNMTDRVYAAFGSMTRPPLLPAGHVSMVFQSGGFGQTLALECGRAGAGFRYLVASGNESDISCLDLIDFYLDDPETHIVVSYIEGLRDGRALLELGRKAAKADKPFILWKGGRGEQGLKVAASHTASMTGRYDIYRSALRQAGIIEVRSLEEVHDFVRVFSTRRLPKGNRVAVMGGSGGSAIVYADAADEQGLKLAEFTEATRKRLLEVVPSSESASNPLDFAAGFLNDVSAPRFGEAVNTIIADPNVDQIAIMLATVQGKQAINGAKALAAAAATSDKPIQVFSSMQADTTGEAFAILQAAGVPVLPSPPRVAQATAKTLDYQRTREVAARLPAFESAVNTAPDKSSRVIRDEAESKALLAKYGIPVTSDAIIDLGQARIPTDLAFPCVVKALSRALPHKTEAGGIVLNVQDMQDVARAIETIRANVAAYQPGLKLDRILVSPLISGGIEIIVGVINDDVFGPTVLVGLGGIYTEVLRDVAYRVAPFDETAARSMIESLNGYGLLKGARGKPPADIAALATMVSRVSQLAWTERATLHELDMNPVFVLPEGRGVVVVDALAVTTEP